MTGSGASIITRRDLLCGAALAMSVAAPGFALAQSSPPGVAEDAVEEVVVTGTRIRGVAPVGSNVVGVGEEEIRQTPAANVTDLLRRVPQINGLGLDESMRRASGPGVSGTNGTRASSISMRGLGPRATLVLFNGQRLPFGGLTGNFPDPSAIPLAAIERVEVVADGASAIYGTDAIAGVVNFIAREQFDGTEVQARYSYADGFDRFQASILHGFNWEGGSAVVALEHLDQSNLNGQERDFVRSNLTSRGGADYRGFQCNPGNILTGSTATPVRWAIPRGGVTPATASQLQANTANRCELTRLGDILPKQDRDSLYLSAQHRFGDRVRVYARGFVSERRYHVQEFAQGSTTTLGTLTVPITNAFFLRPSGTTGSVRVEYDFGPDFGYLDIDGHSRAMQLVGGVDVELPWDWTLGVSVMHSRDDERLRTVGLSTARLNAALASNNPATAFNPFGPGTRPEVLASLKDNLFEPFARSITDSYQIDVSGPVFSLPAGEVRLAAGFEYRDEKTGAGNLRASVAAPTYAFTPLVRRVRSGYAEVFVPLVGADNELPLVRRLDLSAAVRRDDYSATNVKATNPKVGVNWSPVEGLLLKGSYGKSFKVAPQNNPNSVSASFIVTTLTDPLSPTGQSVGLNWNAPGENLDHEKATTYSFTAELTPPQLPGFRVSLTSFSVDYDGQISGVPVATALTNPIYAGQVIRNPTNAQVQALLQQTGLGIQGVPQPSYAFIVDTRPRNLGGTKVEGIDFRATYDTPLSGGDLLVGLSGSYFTKYDVKVTPLAPTEDKRDLIAFPLELRWRAFASFNTGPWTVEGYFNYASGYENNLVTPSQSVDSWTTVDLRVTYGFENAGRWLDGVQLSLQADNVFDNDPPFVNTDGGYDPGAASATGRLVTATITKRW